MHYKQHQQGLSAKPSINPALMPIMMNFLQVLSEGPFATQLNNILFDAISSIQTNYHYWNYLYVNTLSELNNVKVMGTSIKDFANAIFGNINSVHLASHPNDTRKIIWGMLKGPNTPAKAPAEVA